MAILLKRTMKTIKTFFAFCIDEEKVNLELEKLQHLNMLQGK